MLELDDLDQIFLQQTYFEFAFVRAVKLDWKDDSYNEHVVILNIFLCL